MSKSRTVRLLAGLIAGFASSLAVAAPSLAPDPAFSPVGVQALAGEAYGSFVALADDTAGYLLAVGNLGTAQGSDLLIARLTPDGQPDAGFGAGGYQALDLGATDDSLRTGLAVSPERLLVAGQSGGHAVIAAFTRAGHPDAGFGTAGVLRLRIPYTAMSRVYAMVALDDGEVLAVGDAFVAGVQRPLLVRFDRDGRLVESFGRGGLRLITDREGMVGAVARADGGGAWLALRAVEAGEDAYLEVARLRDDASMDPGFGVAGYARVEAGRLSPIVGLYPEGDRLVLALRYLGELVVLDLHGRVTRRQSLLAMGELAVLTRLTDRRWLAGVERADAGGFVSEAALIEEDAQGFRFGARVDLQGEDSGLIVLRDLHADVHGRVTLVGYRLQASTTVPWAARVMLVEAPVPVAASASGAALQPGGQSVAEVGDGGGGGASGGMLLLLAALALRRRVAATRPAPRWSAVSSGRRA